MVSPRLMTGLSIALLCVGCASTRGSGEPWVYGISRSVYGRGPSVSAPLETWPRCDSNGAALAFVAILLLPFALDTVLLPVTLPHDLVCRR